MKYKLLFPMGSYPPVPSMNIYDVEVTKNLFYNKILMSHETCSTEKTR